MECKKIHPLDIPEILSSVALFLTRDSLIECLRVSQLWHRVLLPGLWEATTFYGPGRTGSPLLTSIHSHASHIRMLTIDYDSVLWLSSCKTTFPILANLIIYRLNWRRQFDDPELVLFIKQHNQTIRSVTLGQDANNAVLEALEECPRLESLTLENQGHGSHPAEWIRHFPKLWSRLYSMSLHDNINPGPSTPMAAPAVEWPLSNGPNRVQRLSLTFDLPESAHGFCAWVVKQCPDLVRLQWVQIHGATSPMEQLVEIFRDDSTFGRKLEDITLNQGKIKNHAFRPLMKSLVRLLCLDLSYTNFNQESWMILRTTNPAHLTTLTVLNLNNCVRLPSVAIHQMLCEMPSLKVFVAMMVKDKDIIEDPRPWVCQDLKELTLRLLLTSFSADPSVRTLPVEGYLTRVGQLKKLEVLKDFLPRDEEGYMLLIEVEGGLDKLKDLRRLRNANWVHHFKGENEIRWMLEVWPLLEDSLRSRLQAALERRESFQNSTQ